MVSMETSIDIQRRKSYYNSLSETLKLQIKQAARGAISGTLVEWPMLDAALSECLICLPRFTPARTLTIICRELLEKVTESVPYTDFKSAFSPKIEDIRTKILLFHKLHPTLKFVLKQAAKGKIIAGPFLSMALEKCDLYFPENISDQEFCNLCKIYLDEVDSYSSPEKTWKPVLTKIDFSLRYRKGEFGNAAPTWDTLHEFLDSGYQGLIHLRNRIAGGKTWYNVDSNDVDAAWFEAISSGLKPNQLYISAMAPTEKTLIQGEILSSVEGGFSLYYSTVKKPMRDALREQSATVKGSLVPRILEHYLDSRSLDWMYVLLERYPDHVVEFSVYSTKWGVLPGFNTVFWEVRGGY